MQPSEEIKSKLDIVDVLRDYIQLKAAGTSFRARCPFHHEKTPSFMVSPEKQIWHCFGCGKGGDIFAFVMEMEGISFKEALRMLAQKAGVQLKREDPKVHSERTRLLDIVDLSRKYYHKILTDMPQAEAARRYLKERGLKEETIMAWQIGYSPAGWENLTNFLKSKGFKEDEIFASGMSVKKEGASRFYDRFRDRIMFPINDLNGDTVGFSARVNPDKEKEEKMGKYINSPQTLIYDKSRILFGLDKAKQEIRRQDLAIIVEGQMDVITAHQNGFKNIVASSGTSLTGEQIALLKRYSKNLSLSFDMDKAGEMAADRGIKEAMAAEMNIKVIRIPQGKDPDECIKHDPEEWEKAVKAAKPVMQYYLDKIMDKADMNNIDHRRRAEEILLSKLIEIPNKNEQDFWLRKIAQGMDANESSLREEMRKRAAGLKIIGRPGAPAGERATPPRITKTREEMISELFLALVLKFPQTIEYALNHIYPDQLAGQDNQTLYKNIINYYNNLIGYWTQEGGVEDPPEINYEQLKLWLKEALGDPETGSEKNNEVGEDGRGDSSGQIYLLDKLALLGEKDFYEFDYAQAKSELIKTANIVKRHHLAARMKEVERLIARAESDGDKEAAKALMQEFKILADGLKELEIH